MRARRVIFFLSVLLAVICLAAFVVPSSKRRFESVQCGNTMVSIGFAARLYANDHAGHFPPDLLSISNEVGTPRLLVCPTERSRLPAASWALFSSSQASYEIVTPDLREEDTNGVFLRCKIHRHLGYADGTVFDGVARRTKAW